VKNRLEFDVKDIPRIDFKFIKAYYSFSRFKIYRDDEFNQNLKNVSNFYDLFNHDKKLLNN
jgi:hypothetical protein